MRRAADQTEGRVSCHAAGFHLMNGSNPGKLLWMRHQGEQIIVQSGQRYTSTRTLDFSILFFSFAPTRHI